MKRPLGCYPAVFALALLSVSAVAGQVTGAPKPAPAAGEAVQLSAFVVQTDQDKGCAAMNSTSATRINMTMKDLPLKVTVIPREFLDEEKALDALPVSIFQ